MATHTLEDLQIALIRKATQELKEANDLADRIDAQRKKIARLEASYDPEDWAKADWEKAVLAGMRAYPAADFRTPFCPDAPTMKYMLDKCK